MGEKKGKEKLVVNIKTEMRQQTWTVKGGWLEKKRMRERERERGFKIRKWHWKKFANCMMAISRRCDGQKQNSNKNKKGGVKWKRNWNQTVFFTKIVGEKTTKKWITRAVSDLSEKNWWGEMKNKTGETNGKTNKEMDDGRRLKQRVGLKKKDRIKKQSRIWRKVKEILGIKLIWSRLIIYRQCRTVWKPNQNKKK